MSIDIPDCSCVYPSDEAKNRTDVSACSVSTEHIQEQKRWFVMRDLKRSNARFPAWLLLADMQMEVFTPMKWTIAVRSGKRIRVQVPFIPDLLFVHSTTDALDPIVARTATLQYRYRKGGAYCEPVTVPDKDMLRFIRAVTATDAPRFYLPSEITPSMFGRRIRIVGGPLDGSEGRLVTTRGSRVKRLLVELRGYLAVSVEVSPEYIEVVDI